MKKNLTTQRIVKDLTFLEGLAKQDLGNGLFKRIEVQGNGEIFKDFKIPCSIYFSYYKYNYQGRFIQHQLNTCMGELSNRANNKFAPGMYLAIQSMKADQKSWFNFTKEQLHQSPGLPHNGCHYYIVIQQIKYKNSDNLQSKKLVSQQCREQGKKLFANKEYEKAMKCFQKQINISENLEKKKYNEAQKKQIQAINEKAKCNMLRCFGQLSKFDQATSDLADKYSKQLLKVRNNDDLSIFLRSKVLLQRKYLTNALQLVKQLAKRGNQSGIQLQAEIKHRIQNKNKS